MTAFSDMEKRFLDPDTKQFGNYGGWGEEEEEEEEEEEREERKND